MLCARRDLVILSARGSRREGFGLLAASGVGFCGLPIVSIVVPFWGYLFRILNIEWVKPKKGTTMETIGRIEGAGLGPEGKVSKIWGLYRAQGEASRIWGRRPRAGVQLKACSSEVKEQWFRV